MRLDEKMLTALEETKSSKQRSPPVPEDPTANQTLSLSNFGFSDCVDDQVRINSPLKKREDKYEVVEEIVL